MDMSGMMMSGGMDSSGADMFQVTNIKIAKIFWYFVAAVVAIGAVRRGSDHLRTLYAKRNSNSRHDVPSRPSSFVARLYDTTVTICRESSYPQLRPFTGSFSRYLSTPTLGQALLLLAYWIMILIMLWSNVILTPTSSIYGFKWEIVGFRAAWVSVTQLPLIYCLGGKSNIISMITGISYERINWLHRWVSRTIFLTVIVHWSFFFREWWLADFVQEEIKIMSMVKYGFGAWAVLGWFVLTGFGFFRDKIYELWLLQHLASAGVLLWLLYVHVPSYARYNIWLSIGFVAFDRGIRGIWSLVRNLHVTSLWRKVQGNQSVVGFNARVESHGDGYLSMTIENVNFSWQPGQHVFISVPTCGIFESHPFTISNSPDDGTNSMQLYFKAHTGFTGRLRKRAEANGIANVRTFVSGPWGNPPTSKIDVCNSLVFVASSTGASFTVPLFEHAVRNAKFVQRITLHWIIRHDSQLKTFMPRITAALKAAQDIGIEAECRVFITNEPEEIQRLQVQDNDKQEQVIVQSSDSSLSEVLLEKTSLPLLSQPEPQVKLEAFTSVRSTSSGSSAASINTSIPSEIQKKMHTSAIVFHQGRPQSWDNLLHPVLVEAEGGTVIVACGGRSLMADVRNYVAWISDQRAVHKGTGAQGISLYTESYGW